MAKVTQRYSPDDVEEFDRKLRHFSESLAHRERRMLRQIIAAALEDEDDTAGYLELSDEDLFKALARILTTSESVSTG